ncbi:hypothetical protein TIFTF001_009944 [Ficus carica]|uniref:Uncharacterized protein n=1 Tax=Ficus carica TaxID=3494 RepID=A0AA87ZP34_FICCA|nr:hypothetical protein TIFTF001_009944 [Ficus carica]
MASKDKLKVKGIFRREVSEHTAPCSGGAASPEIPLEDDNSTLFVDEGLTCVQRLYQDCYRRKKHTLLSGG